MSTASTQAPYSQEEAQPPFVAAQQTAQSISQPATQSATQSATQLPIESQIDMSAASTQAQPSFAASQQTAHSISQPATQSTTQSSNNNESQTVIVSELLVESQPRTPPSTRAARLLPAAHLPNDVPQTNAVQAIATMMFLRVRLCRRLERLRERALAELERLSDGSLAISELQGMPGNPLALGASPNNALSQVLNIIESLPKEFAHFADHKRYAPLTTIQNQLQVIFAVGFVAGEQHVAFFFEHVLSQWPAPRTGVPNFMETFKKGRTYRKKSALWNTSHHLFWLPTDVNMASVDLITRQLRAMFGPSPTATIPLELVIYGGLLCARLNSIDALSNIGQHRIVEQAPLQQTAWRLTLGTFDEVGEATVRATIDDCKRRREPPEENVFQGLPCPISAPSVPTTTTTTLTITASTVATSSSTAATSNNSSSSATSTSDSSSVRSRARSAATSSTATGATVVEESDVDVIDVDANLYFS
jgi:hypothetical protein